MGNKSKIEVELSAIDLNLTKVMRSGEVAMERFAATNQRISARIEAGAAQLAARLGSIGIGIGAAVSALGAGKLIQVTREFDKVSASLETSTGSVDRTAVAFASLEEFAKNTPYDLAQVANAFITLVNMGLNPSERALTSYGDTASAFSKDIIQVIEAVADATTGEFERAKEAFKVKTKVMGDQVAFTFRGMTTVVGNNAKEIEEYFIKLGENNFAGAQAKRMKTLDGAVSNLGDSWDKLFRTISGQGIEELMAEGARKSADSLDWLSAKIKEVGDLWATVNQKISLGSSAFAAGIGMDPINGEDGTRGDQLRAAIAQAEKDLQSLNVNPTVGPSEQQAQAIDNINGRLRDFRHELELIDQAGQKTAGVAGKKTDDLAQFALKGGEGAEKKDPKELAAAYRSAFGTIGAKSKEVYAALAAEYAKDRDEFIAKTGDKVTANAVYAQKMKELDESAQGKKDRDKAAKSAATAERELNTEMQAHERLLMAIDATAENTADRQLHQIEKERLAFVASWADKAKTATEHQQRLVEIDQWAADARAKIKTAEAKRQADEARAQAESAVSLREAQLAEQEAKGTITANEALDQQVVLLRERRQLLLDHLQLLPKNSAEEITAYNSEAMAIANVNRELAEKERQMRMRDGFEGFKQGMQNFETQAANVGDKIAQSTERTFEAMSDVITSFITTGKLRFEDLRTTATSVLQSIASAMVQQSIVGPASGMLSSGLGALFSGMFGGGGGAVQAYGINPGQLLGRADGGPVAAGKMYRINERAIPEILNLGSKQYLMMGQQSGSVTPLRASSMAASGSGAAPEVRVFVENYGPTKMEEPEYLSENMVRIIAREEARGVVSKETDSLVAGALSNPNSKASKSVARNLDARRRR